MKKYFACFSLFFLTSYLIKKIARFMEIAAAVNTSVTLILSSAPTHANEVPSCAASLLKMFCRLNWTGPPLTSEESEAIAALAPFNGQSLEVLSMDGEV